MAFHPKRFNFGVGGALPLQRVIRVALLIFALLGDSAIGRNFAFGETGARKLIQLRTNNQK